MTEKRILCPRDGADLKIDSEYGVEVDRCGTCNGAWYDNDELAALESTIASDDDRKGMIDYAKRESELDCPVCKKRMRAFNYRAYNLELDACTDDHGFWLDAGEANRVREIIEERVAGLRRAGQAEVDWANAKRGKKGGFFSNLFGKK